MTPTPPDDAPSPGPWYTDFGPLDGPIRPRDAICSIGVHATPQGTVKPAGMAHPAGWVAGKREGDASAVWQLTVGGVELEGWYVCVGRRFEKLGDSAEVESM